jgi:hypothetical protein
MFLRHQIPFTYTFELSNGFYETSDKKLVTIDLEDMFRVGRLILSGFNTFVKMNAPSTVLSQHRRPERVFRQSSKNLVPYTTTTLIGFEEIAKAKGSKKKKVVALRTK